MRYPSGCSIKDGIAFITIGADGLVSGIESIRSGKLTATVDVSSIGIGTAMIDTVFAHEVIGQTVSDFVRSHRRGG